MQSFLEFHVRVDKLIWNSTKKDDERGLIVQVKVSADNKDFHSSSKRKTYETRGSALHGKTVEWKNEQIDAGFDRDEYERLVLSAVEFQSHLQIRVLAKNVSGKKEIGRCSSIGVRDAIEGWVLPESPPDTPRSLRVKGLDDATLYITVWMTRSNDLCVLETAMEGNLDAEEDGDETSLVSRFFEITRQLGLDRENDTHLYWIAKEVLETQLPSRWCLTNVGTYFNELTGQESKSHPALSVFRHVLKKYRSSSTKTENRWICLSHKDNEIYVNVTNGQIASICPTDEDLIERPDVLVTRSSKVMKSVRRAPRGKFMSSKLKHLRFKSWWKEGYDKQSRCFVNLKYNLLRGNFHISFRRSSDDIEDDNGDDVEYVVPEIIGRRGPVMPWNLFVGSEIELFGRKTTLRQADGPTSEWIDRHGKYLTRLRDELELEVRKYRVMNHTKYQSFEIGGKTNLGRVMDEIQDLKDMLCEYRPEVARRVIEKHSSSEPFADLFL